MEECKDVQSRLGVFGPLAQAVQRYSKQADSVRQAVGTRAEISMSRASYNGEGEPPTPPMGGTPGPTTGTQGPPAEGFGIGTYGGAGGAEDGTVRVEIGTPDGMNDFNIYIYMADSKKYGY